MAGALGVRAGALFAGLLRDREVELLAGARVAGIDADDGGARVTLADGSVITADTVLVAIGSVLNTGWLGPLAGPAGLICDRTGQVEGHHGVYAVGDIASWPDPVAGAPRRKAFYHRLIAAGAPIGEFADAAGSAEPFG